MTTQVSSTAPRHQHHPHRHHSHRHHHHHHQPHDDAARDEHKKGASALPATELNPAAIAHARTLNHVPWCAEYEKMISGMTYDPLDPILMDAKWAGKSWQKKYNDFLPDVPTRFEGRAARQPLLEEFLGRVGEGAHIEPPFSADYGANISIGKGFYSNYNCIILDDGLVTIGDRVMFGPNVSIISVTHDTEVQARRDWVEFTAPVSIGDDCWLGAHVCVLPGVAIGKGCTIGAGSVVTRDIPDWSVAFGNPARVVRKVTPLPDPE